MRIKLPPKRPNALTLRHREKADKAVAWLAAGGGVAEIAEVLPAGVVREAQKRVARLPEESGEAEPLRKPKASKPRKPKRASRRVQSVSLVRPPSPGAPITTAGGYLRV